MSYWEWEMFIFRSKILYSSCIFNMFNFVEEYEHYWSYCCRWERGWSPFTVRVAQDETRSAVNLMSPACSGLTDLKSNIWVLPEIRLHFLFPTVVHHVEVFELRCILNTKRKVSWAVMICTCNWLTFSPWCLILMLSPGRILQSSRYHRPSTSTWLTSHEKLTGWRSSVSTSFSSFTMYMSLAGRKYTKYGKLLIEVPSLSLSLHNFFKFELNF